MFNRFRNGLLMPRGTIKYEKEKWYLTLLYFFLLSLLATIPYCISISSNDTIHYDYRNEFREAFSNENIDYQIVNYQLVKIGSNENKVYSFSNHLNISFNQDIFVDQYKKEKVSYLPSMIVFCKDGVVYDKPFFEKITFKYVDYQDLLNEGLNFSLEKDYYFWETVFTIANAEYSKLHKKLAVYYTIENFVANAGQIFIFALMLGFFQKLFSYGINNKRYKEHLVSSIYILTPYVVFSLLATLYNINLLWIVGLIITAVYSYKVNQRI